MSTFPELNLGIFTVTSGPGRLLPNVSHATLHYDVFDIIQGQRLVVSTVYQTNDIASKYILTERIRWWMLTTKCLNVI